MLHFANLVFPYSEIIEPHDLICFIDYLSHFIFDAPKERLKQFISNKNINLELINIHELIKQILSEAFSNLLFEKL